MNQRKMKVLQVGKFYPVQGGVEKVMYDLMTGLSAAGVDCDMLCAGLEGDNREVALNAKARLLICKTWFKLAATMISPAMIFRLWKICGQYDIIHVHHPDPMACLALFCSGYKGKVVLHWHSDILKQKFLLQFYRPLQNWLIRRADLIVGTTPVYLKESPFLANVQPKTACVPIGIEAIQPDEAAVAAVRKQYPGKKIIFSLGRLIGYKGFTYLVDAARFLEDRYLILIGGTGPLQETLQKQIENSGLTEKVKMLGYISDKDLPAYYGACDLFCLSSIQKTEAFGIVQIEAMSCGKPVVATRIPQSGVAWVNAEQESGMNVPPENAKELAEAIHAILKEEEVYAGFSHRAKLRYESWFTQEKMIQKCLDLYQWLLCQ